MSKKENYILLNQVRERFLELNGSAYHFHEKYDINSMTTTEVIDAFKAEIDRLIKNKKKRGRKIK